MKRACLLMTILSLPLIATPKMHGPDYHTRHAPTEGPKIRVLLAQDVNAALLEVKGPYRVVRRDISALLSAGSLGKRYVVHGIEEGLRWGEEFPDTPHFTVIPMSPKTQFFVNGFQYKGAMTILLGKNREITVINEVPIEDFVKSVLAIKYQEPVSKEAGAALAIVERTKVYSKLNRDGLWDVTAQESGYFGYGVTHQKNGADEVVDWTPFMVMQSRNGKRGLADVRLSATKARELAEMGCDARRILSECFPSSQLGLIR